MSLFGRITADDTTKIHVHRFGAALRQWAAGEVTRAQIVSVFALTTGEQTELDALRATYDALGTGNASQAFAKAAWLERMEDVFTLVEFGDYDEAKAKSALGF